MRPYRQDLPPVPPRLRKRPIDHRGFPVPWFTPFIDGEWNFQVADFGKITHAISADLCWICGERLGRHKAFVIGPMCAVNRTTSEPPSHRDCAEFAAQACPFLVKPRMRRTPRDEEARSPGGIMLERNPGVALVWVTSAFRPFKVGNGLLIEIGEPLEVSAWAEGRPATSSEIEASITSGLPALVKLALSDADYQMLRMYLQRACRILGLSRLKMPSPGKVAS